MTNPGPPQTWTVEGVLRWATDDFRGRGIDRPRLDAEVLLAHALGTTRMQLGLDNENGESAREEFSQQIQEGARPETTSAT